MKLKEYKSIHEMDSGNKSGIVDGGETASSEVTISDVEDVSKLEETLKYWQEQRQILESKRDEVKKKYMARVDKEAAVRLGKSKRDPNEDKHKLCRIFGLEVAAQDETGCSLVMHHWTNGHCVGKSSVAIEESSKTPGRLAVTSYNMPHVVEWVKKAPCLVPEELNFQEAVMDINSSCIGYYSRKQQLDTFQEQFPEVDVTYNHNLTRIILELSLIEDCSGRPISFSLELVYEPFKLIYPSNIKVSVNSKSKAISAESEEEMVDRMNKQTIAFQSMTIADAYFFCFKAKDESTGELTLP
ncbi:hypothetical protein B566_EDAN000978 [Ephemera danica]|nr:hypothetical protein B566_EDAN000978 [Ephemera danica]